jgi:hypothetical protein
MPKRVLGAPAPLPNPNKKSPALGRNKGKVGKPTLMPSGPRGRVPMPVAPGSSSKNKPGGGLIGRDGKPISKGMPKRIPFGRKSK